MSPVNLTSLFYSWDSESGRNIATLCAAWSFALLHLLSFVPFCLHFCYSVTIKHKNITRGHHVPVSLQILKASMNSMNGCWLWLPRYKIKPIWRRDSDLLFLGFTGSGSAG